MKGGLKWTREAEALLSSVPFFVRQKVRGRVEDDVRQEGGSEVTDADVHRSRERFLRRMSAQVRGYQLDNCFGTDGCPNRAVPADGLRRKLDQVLRQADLLAFLKSQVGDELKLHHEFRVSLAECPNACSQPQIKDIGIIGAVRPQVTDVPCTRCAACVYACPDRAVFLAEDKDRPDIDAGLCQSCGLCVSACPSAAMADLCRGFRVLVGGKLGRHPRLARELPGILTEDGVVAVVQETLRIYKQTSRNGRRFAHILTDAHYRRLADVAADNSRR